jgi:hypothetical protein
MSAVRKHLIGREEGDGERAGGKRHYEKQAQYWQEWTQALAPFGGPSQK